MNLPSILKLLGALTVSLVGVPRAYSAPDQAAGESWPMHRGGPLMHGVAPSDLPDDLELLWTYEAEDSIKSSPVISADGTVYVGSDDGAVQALDLFTGELRWSASITRDSRPIEATPLLLKDRLYVGSDDYFFYCLDRETGEIVWEYETEEKILGSANYSASPLDENVTWILFGSYDTHLYCLEAGTGELVWRTKTESYVNGTPALTPNGDVFFGGCDHYLYVLDLRDGKILHQTDSGGYIASSPAVAGSMGYIGNYDNRVLAVDLADGTIKWRYRFRNFAFYSSPAMRDGAIYLGGRDKHVHALDQKTGELIWRVSTRGRVDSSPVLCDDSLVVGSSDGLIYRLSLEDGSERWSYEVGNEIISSPAVAQQIMVIADEDGFVYAFGQPRNDGE